MYFVILFVLGVLCPSANDIHIGLKCLRFLVFHLKFIFNILLKGILYNMYINTCHIYLHTYIKYSIKRQDNFFILLDDNQVNYKRKNMPLHSRTIWNIFLNSIFKFWKMFSRKFQEVWTKLCGFTSYTITKQIEKE